MFTSLRIPLTFLIIGICWAILSNPIITFFYRHLAPAEQDSYRSLNDLVFVIIITAILYYKIKKQQRKISKSEEEYRQLFESNPNPLWIYDDNLKFVKVNNAAIEKYGHKKRKFLRMTINDICPADNSENVNDQINTDDNMFGLAGTWKHKKATGEIFDVSIISYPVLFDNKRCNLVMATDISELLEKELKLEEAYQKIKTANDTLLHIAWSNSHELRKPLCSILSLIAFLKETNNKQERIDCLRMLEISSTELDKVLKQNSDKVNELEMEDAF